MSVRKLLYSSGVCTHCQHGTLNPFVTFAGLSVSHLLKPDGGQGRVLPRDLRRLSTSSVQFEDSDSQPSAIYHGSTVAKTQSKDRSFVLEQGGNQQSAVPWYLQVSAQDTTIPVTRYEEIPEIPEDAPMKLRPILERLSVEIGLDELRLIDLRNLDPPPALGSNLLMVVGTARSEKHLHVSADRFCRWLRSEYGMSPYADGLLGRNELKIKLRRKARRVKLLGSTSKGPDADDGIRSNWICVNVGPIEKSRGTVQSLNEEGVVGFGGCEDGAQLVVQMMTEDKRGEIDLENLWSRVAERHVRKQYTQISGSEHQCAAHEEISLRVSRPREVSTIKTLTSHSQPTLLPRIHSRNFHNPARRVGAVQVPWLGLDHTDAEGFHDSFASLLSHLSFLQSLPRKDAFSALGQGAHDRTSTPFLSRFYGLIPVFPDRRHWGAKLALVQYGINLGHEQYTTDDLINILNEAHEAASTLPSNSYSLVIQSIIDTMPKDFYNIKKAKHALPLDKIVTLLENMELRNIDIKSTPIMRNLYIAFEKTRLAEVESGHSFLHSLSAARLAQFFDDHTSLVPPLSLPILAMDQLATARRWNEFWKYWRQLPINLLRRPQVLYTAMFNHVARTGHQKMCIDALAEWIPNLAIEQPPVEITADLAEAILACLKTADPLAEEHVRNESNKKGQWAKLFKRCVKGFDRPVEDTDKMQAEAERVYGAWRLPVS